MTSKPTAPEVYRTLDYRRFLADWFAWKKQINPRFSHRVFARLAKQKSPSLLKHVIDGRRNLTAPNVALFAQAMKLDRAASAFFAALVDLEQADDAEGRNRAWQRISATRRFREARRIEGEGFRYLSHWYYPAIRELAARADFRDDPAWLARTLRPRITVAQARTALSELRSMGLLIEADGQLLPAEASVVTPAEVLDTALHNYHQGMIARAAEAVEGFAPHERHLLGVTVAIPAALVPQLKQELNDIQARLLDLCDSAAGEPERVFQLNLHLFPLSAPLESE